MGFLDSLFGRKKASETIDVSMIEDKCLHAALRPHWQRAEDFGKHELISSYVCETCGQTFSKDEGERVSATVGESVRGTVEFDESMRKTIEEEKAHAEGEYKYLP